MASPWIQTSLPLELLPFLISGPPHLQIPIPHGGTHEAYSWSGSSSPSRSSSSSSPVVASGEDFSQGVVQSHTTEKGEADGTGSGMKKKKIRVACGFCHGRCIS